MAQKNNKQANKRNENGINVINPETLNEAEIKQLNDKTEKEKEALETKLKGINKQIRGKLWIWWFLPIFGWFIYAFIMQNRLQKEENVERLVLVKREIAEKEIQLMLNKKQLDLINENKN